MEKGEVYGVSHLTRASAVATRGLSSGRSRDVRYSCCPGSPGSGSFLETV